MKLDEKELKALAQEKLENDEGGWFRKDAEVEIRDAYPGEKIVTITGDDHIETENTAERNQKVVRNPDGEEYIIDEEVYENNYENIGEIPVGLSFVPHQSLGEERYCVQVDSELEFEAPWGEDMVLQEGGYLVINDVDEGDIYGIQEEEFLETYTTVE